MSLQNLEKLSGPLQGYERWHRPSYQDMATVVARHLRLTHATLTPEKRNAIFRAEENLLRRHWGTEDKLDAAKDEVEIVREDLRIDPDDLKEAMQAMTRAIKENKESDSLLLPDLRDCTTE